jgi:hypothetical protein
MLKQAIQLGIGTFDRAHFKSKTLPMLIHPKPRQNFRHTSAEIN